MRLSILGGLIATMLAIPACHTMTQVSMEQVEDLRPSRVWVTRSDQSVVLVSGPQVFGDTLVGYVAGAFQEISAAGVTQLVVRRPAKGKTIALLAAGTVGAATLVVLISGAGKFDDPRSRIDCDYEPEHIDCQ